MEPKPLVEAIILEGSVTRVRMSVRHVSALPCMPSSVVQWLPCNITISARELMKMRMENKFHFGGAI